ncbi:MAG: hypothetical protein ACE5H4_15720, partial [Candidatus Thorarchaeota archaeon]
MSVNRNEENSWGIFEAFVKSVIDLFGSKTAGQLPYSRIRKISRGPEGHRIVFEIGKKTDLIYLQRIFWEEILQLQSSSECISAIESSPIFREALNTTVYIPHFP